MGRPKKMNAITENNSSFEDVNEIDFVENEDEITENLSVELNAEDKTETVNSEINEEVNIEEINSEKDNIENNDSTIEIMPENPETPEVEPIVYTPLADLLYTKGSKVRLSENVEPFLSGVGRNKRRVINTSEVVNVAAISWPTVSLRVKNWRYIVKTDVNKIVNAVVV